jgi:regulator of sigma E protease
VITLISFIVLLSILIFVHEFGHFLAARIAGVGVLKFSLGFGPKIIGKKIGETEYVLSWIPLGGFVKLLGEQGNEELPPEDEKRSFFKQPVWKRMLIVSAGPLFNFLLAILIFIIVFMHGLPSLTPVIGQISPDSFASKAGILSGDKILSIDNKKITYWNEIEPIIDESKGREIQVVVQRDNQQKTIIVKPKLSKVKNVFGEEESIYLIEGLLPVSNMVAVIGEMSPDSAAKEAGILTGDKIISLNGKKITYWEEIRPIINASKGNEVGIVIQRGNDEKTINVKPKLSKGKNIYGEDVYLIGISTAGYVHSIVGKISSDSAAKEAGILTGDKILSINDKRIDYWEQISKIIAESKSSEIKVVVQRGNEEKVITVKQKLSGIKSIFGKDSAYVIGMSPASNEIIERKNPLTAITTSFSKTWEISKLTLLSVVKMIQGVISPRTLGGPIFIAQVAGAQVKEGIIPFILFMAILSINLGVVNLFPIPVLDGGHIFFYMIEIVTRREISVKVKEMSQQIGFVILLMLMLFVIFIDIERLNIKFINDIMKIFK